jgi:G3E family GTPase
MHREETAHALRSALAGLNPLADIVPASQLVGWLAHEEARGDGAQRVLQMPLLRPTLRARPHGIRSTVIRAGAPASWPQFAIWLTRLAFVHGDRILRTKGVLFDRERQLWIGVHGVRRFFHPPVHLALPAPPACGACLVFITERLDPALIEASYRRLMHDGTREEPAGANG